MARTSSAGLPHLTCRPDAGQFTYHRSFRSGIVPFLKGELRPSWSRRTVALDGRQVIKVSLGTGDRRLAVTRWDELHPLVQAAVREAERREAAARTAERDRVSPERLAPEAVRAMAGQVLHTVLADHDLTYIDPGHLNGTAQAVRKVLALTGSGAREPGRSARPSGPSVRASTGTPCARGGSSASTSKSPRVRSRCRAWWRSASGVTPRR